VSTVCISKKKKHIPIFSLRDHCLSAEISLIFFSSNYIIMRTRNSYFGMRGIIQYCSAWSTLLAEVRTWQSQWFVAISIIIVWECCRIFFYCGACKKYLMCLVKVFLTSVVAIETRKKDNHMPCTKFNGNILLLLLLFPSKFYIIWYLYKRKLPLHGYNLIYFSLYFYFFL
jgi:hypothetical protein